MRRMDKNKLADLKDLTGLRKALQAAESTILQTRLERKQVEISILKAPVADHDSSTVIQDNARWQEWRRLEILRLNAEKANIQAQFLQARKTLGRATAEDETAKHLNKVFKVERSKQDK